MKSRYHNSLKPPQAMWIWIDLAFYPYRTVMSLYWMAVWFDYDAALVRRQHDQVDVLAVSLPMMIYNYASQIRMRCENCGFVNQLTYVTLSPIVEWPVWLRSYAELWQSTVALSAFKKLLFFRWWGLDAFTIEVETVVSFEFCNFRMAGGWYNSVAVGLVDAVRNIWEDKKNWILVTYKIVNINHTTTI